MQKLTKLIFLSLLIFTIFAIFNYYAPKPEISTKKVLSTVSNIFITTFPINPNSKCHARFIDQNDPQAVLPDPTCTPGVINNQVTQDNLYETICKSGFTKTIRPSSYYTNKLKKEQIIEYGYFDTNLKSYEEDHLISLELGGDPSSPLNLWPEPHGSPNEKDRVENYLNREICNGNISLTQAQKEISNNWYAVYKKIQINYPL